MSSGLKSFGEAQTAGVARALSSDIWSLAEVLGPSEPIKAFLLCSKTFHSGAAAAARIKGSRRLQSLVVLKLNRL